MSVGVVDLFDQNAADLSGISTAAQLFVTDVVHQANITVDESGTEAAAATAVVGSFICMCPPPEVTLTIDRPFIYLISDDATGEILFIGRVLDPSAG